METIKSHDLEALRALRALRYRTPHHNLEGDTLDEAYERYEEAVAAGDTNEDFESWYSGLCASAYDDAKDAQQDREMGL